MSSNGAVWKKVAALNDLNEGGAKAISLGQGRSIALFKVEDRIYATDNQCPHIWPC